MGKSLRQGANYYKVALLLYAGILNLSVQNQGKCNKHFVIDTKKLGYFSHGIL